MVAQPVLSLRAFFIFFFFFFLTPILPLLYGYFYIFLLILFQNLFVKKFFVSRFSNKDSWKIIEDNYIFTKKFMHLLVYEKKKI